MSDSREAQAAIEQLIQEMRNVRPTPAHSETGVDVPIYVVSKAQLDAWAQKLADVLGSPPDCVREIENFLDKALASAEVRSLTPFIELTRMLQRLHDEWKNAAETLRCTLDEPNNGANQIDLCANELLPALIFASKLITVRSQPSQEGWQPITTAPKDHGYLLLVSPAHGRVIGAPVTGDVWHFVGVGAVTGESERPTHWMRLPNLPASAEGSIPSLKDRER